MSVGNTLANMRVQLWANKMKKSEDDTDYVVYQKQRTGADDGSPGYETVCVGYGRKMEAPSGEIYLDVKIEGFSDNKPKKP